MGVARSTGEELSHTKHFGAYFHFLRRHRQLGQDPQKGAASHHGGAQWPVPRHSPSPKTELSEAPGFPTESFPENKSHKPSWQSTGWLPRSLEVVSSLTPLEGALLGRHSQPHGVESPVPTLSSSIFFP